MFECQFFFRNSVKSKQAVFRLDDNYNRFLIRWQTLPFLPSSTISFAKKSFSFFLSYNTHEINAIISIFLGKRSLAMRYSTEKSLYQSSRNIIISIITVASFFSWSMSDLSYQTDCLYQSFTRFIHNDSL
jgi:hypothetical protein